MFDSNQHRFYLMRILKDIYADIELANLMGFKGGTALMFLYDFPRFSVDLDFNLIEVDREELVYKKVHKILLKYGTIHDEAKKYFGSILVLDYGKGERKLKVEISNRKFDDQYEIKNWLGINLKVMVVSDMFAHKLCALLDRASLAKRDLFDTWFFMNQHTPVNQNIVEMRMEMPFSDYCQKCINVIQKLPEKGMLQGLGELMDKDLKNFVQKKLKTETISLLQFYKTYPIFK